MEENTVQYWLNKAKEEGYEWADAALENARIEERLNKRAFDIYEAILWGFTWGQTSQGSYFWSQIGRPFWSQIVRTEVNKSEV